jgi:protein phosphatase
VSVTEPLVLPGALTLALDAAAESIAGPRPDNQDAGLAGPRLVAVADGVGGSAGGAVAAALVVERLSHAADDAAGDAPDLGRAVSAANDELAAAVAREPSLRSMATTLTGDSRLYLLRRGELVRLTRDDTLVQSLVDAGTITAEQARTHPLRSVVLAALHGRAGDVAEVHHSAVPVAPGDRLLLCTDGLCGAVPEGTIRHILIQERAPAACARRLLRAALVASTTDNVTAVVADVTVHDDGKPAPGARVGAAR